MIESLPEANNSDLEEVLRTFDLYLSNEVYATTGGIPVFSTLLQTDPNWRTLERFLNSVGDIILDRGHLDSDFTIVITMINR